MYSSKNKRIALQTKSRTRMAAKSNGQGVQISHASWICLPFLDPLLSTSLLLILSHMLYLCEWVSEWVSVYAIFCCYCWHFFSPAFQLNRRKWIDSIYMRCKQMRHYFHVYASNSNNSSNNNNNIAKVEIRQENRKKAISQRHGFRKFLTFCGGYSMLLTCSPVHLSQISQIQIHYTIFAILQTRNDEIVWVRHTDGPFFLLYQALS